MGKCINVSIVLYKSNPTEMLGLVDLLSGSLVVNEICLVDNSPIESTAYQNCSAKYIFSGSNLGYGSGHNIAIRNSIDNAIKYHLVLNSDISFDINILDSLIDKLDSDNSIGLIMPKVLNIDGTSQILPKLLPSPFNLLIRVIPFLGKMFILVNKRYTLYDYKDCELNVPIISGCFSLFRVKAIEEIGLYDENFFMYFEDFDISRRMHKKYKSIYFPEVSIVHAHERGAAKSFKLFKVFIKSAITYFNKYGWFFDRERVRVNNNVLKQLKKQ